MSEGELNPKETRLMGVVIAIIFLGVVGFLAGVPLVRAYRSYVCVVPITVEITEIIETIILIAFFSAGAICFLAFAIMNFDIKSTDDRAMIDDMKVCNNLMTKLFYPMVFLLSFGSAMITETLFWDEPMNNSIGIASGALGVICLIYVIIDIKSLPKRPYYVSLQTCVNVTEEDCDYADETRYYSDFTDVKHVKFRAKQGATYYIVQDYSGKVRKCYYSYYWRPNIEDKSLNKGSKALMLRMIITLLLCICISVLCIALLNFGV